MKRSHSSTLPHQPKAESGPLRPWKSDPSLSLSRKSKSVTPELGQLKRYEFKSNRSHSDVFDRKTKAPEFQKPDLKKCLSLDLLDPTSTPNAALKHSKSARRRGRPVLERKQPMLFKILPDIVFGFDDFQASDSTTNTVVSGTVSKLLLHASKDQHFMAEWSLVTIFLMDCIPDFLMTVLKEYRKYKSNVDNGNPSEILPVSLQTSISFKDKTKLTSSSPELIIFASNQKKRLFDYLLYCFELSLETYDDTRFSIDEFFSQMLSCPLLRPEEIDYISKILRRKNIGVTCTSEPTIVVDRILDSILATNSSLTSPFTSEVFFESLTAIPRKYLSDKLKLLDGDREEILEFLLQHSFLKQNRSNLIKVNVSKERLAMAKLFNTAFVVPISAPQLSLVFLEVNVKEFGKQLCLYARILFQKINLYEFYFWVQKDTTLRNMRAPNLLAVSSFANQLSSWVVTEIVSTANFKSRVTVVKKFISLAAFCWKFGNLDSALQIYYGLNYPAVTRLKATWEELNSKHQDSIAELTQLRESIESEKNFGSLRKLVEKFRLEGKPCVPYLGVFLQDIIYFADSTETLLDNGHVSWRKLSRIASLFKHITELQKPSYLFVPNLLWQEFFSRHIYSLKAEALFKLSKQLEPLES